MLLALTAARFAIGRNRHVEIPALAIHPGECWAVVGRNGSGKTALAQALAGDLPLTAGHRQGQPRCSLLSFEQQQALAEVEWQRLNSDFLKDDEDPGLTLDQLLAETGANQTERQQTAAVLGIAPLLDRPYRVLSSGEGRKALLARALLAKPQLLILDEPFDGLDLSARQRLTTLLIDRHRQGQTMVVIVNRVDEIPPCTSHLGLVDGCCLRHAARYTAEDLPLLNQVEQSPPHLTALPQPLTSPAPLPPGPLVKLTNGQVSHDGMAIIQGLSWQVEVGQHWLISGPNGAGKSTLLALISGDHPQAYSNDLWLFGRRRGSGETVWQIKERIGVVSPALHLAYRVATTPLAVVLSGYFDSIGVYQQPGDLARKRAMEWLELLGLAAQAQQPFHSLSFGQQRLLLIARALVKQPPLVILDEPLQGLDGLNRALVLRFIDLLIGNGRSQLLYVSHHAADLPRCLSHHLQFVAGDGGYRYQQTAL